MCISRAEATVHECYAVGRTLCDHVKRRESFLRAQQEHMGGESERVKHRVSKSHVTCAAQERSRVAYTFVAGIVGSGGEQQLEHRVLAGARGAVDRREAVLCEAIDQRLVLEQQLHHRQLAKLACQVQRANVVLLLHTRHKRAICVNMNCGLRCSPPAASERTFAGKFTSAPRSISSVATFTFPYFAAMCSGVNPLCAQSLLVHTTYH